MEYPHKKIKAQRMKHRLSQADVADRAGVTQQFVSHLEKGRAKDLHRIAKVVNALGGIVTINFTADDPT